MSSKNVKNSNTSFAFSGRGLVALLALIVLGGGALVFSRMTNDNQNNPNINVTGGQQNIEGSIVEGVNITSGSPDSSITTAKPESDESPDTKDTPTNQDQNAQAFKKILEAPENKWVLTFPIFKVVADGKCIKAGRGSITLLQRENGDLYYPEYSVNGYGGGNTTVRGTVTSSGQVSLYLDSNNGGVTFDGRAELKNSSIVAFGKATMPEFNCPESDFSLELN